MKKWVVALIIFLVLIVLIIAGVFAYKVYSEYRITKQIESYVCPEPGKYINCMPGPGNNGQYCEWVRTYCPDAKIAW